VAILFPNLDVQFFFLFVLLASVNATRSHFSDSTRASDVQGGPKKLATTRSSVNCTISLPMRLDFFR